MSILTERKAGRVENALIEADAASPTKRQNILLASTTWWAFPAKLAIAFAAAGAKVDVICPNHHPLYATRVINRSFRYSAVRPLESLANAIALADPGVIVPCDDRTVTHLHGLHTQSRSGDGSIADVIERSLGNPESFSTADRRSDFIHLARKLGIRAPAMLQINNEGELAEGISQLGLPAIMKVDGTWGGMGVKVVRTTEQATRTFADLSRSLSVLGIIKQQLLDRDPFAFLPWLRQERPIVNIQQYIPGRPANCTVACHKGEVLAYIGAEVMSSSSEFSASTVVRVTDNAEMRRTATKLVRQLDISGFCGFDFVLDSSGAAHLVEMNPRATPLTHLALGSGRDPVGALASLVLGPASLERSAATAADTISFFPQAWHQHPASDLLDTSFHDIPWTEPGLIRELSRRPWPERGVISACARLARDLLHFRWSPRIYPNILPPPDTSARTATINRQSF